MSLGCLGRRRSRDRSLFRQDLLDHIIVIDALESDVVLFFRGFLRERPNGSGSGQGMNAELMIGFRSIRGGGGGDTSGVGSLQA
jgi:hypothetical protein